MVYGSGGVCRRARRFMVVNWLATAAAHDLANPGRQYGGLFASPAPRF